MKSIYEKNVTALHQINTPLYYQLLKVEENQRFEVFQGHHEDDINIKDTRYGTALYTNPIKDIENQAKAFSLFREYDFLYFFGLGNGVLVKKLFSNPKHQQIVIVEPELELIYIALNLIDFSKELTSMRLMITLADDLTYNTACKLFVYNNALLFARVFQLHPMLAYYEHFYHNEITASSSVMTAALEYVVSVAGNSVIDQFVGLQQHLQNIPRMLHGPKFTQLIQKKNTDTAIIVSTGPSLHKQLPLLDRIKEHVTIISVDASLPVLEKANIKPDIVVSMERDEISGIFHQNTSQEFQEGILFVCASLQHENVFKAIRAGTTLLVMRPFAHNYFLGIDDYGYVCYGLSSANMAHELAALMRFQTCVFIGQDLAYGADGSSHTKGHVLGNEQIKENGADSFDQQSRYEVVELLGYGGDHMVKSILPWKLFMNGLVQTVEQALPYMRSINATEGGARIEGTEELPFQKVVSNIVDTSIHKKPIQLEYPDESEYQFIKRKIDKKIEQILIDGEKLQREVEETFLFIADQCKRLEHKELDEAIQEFSVEETIELLDKISAIRNLISNDKIFEQFYHDIMQSNVVHEELRMMEIKVKPVNNPHENQEKALQWILEHRYWLFSIAGSLHNTIEIIKKTYPFED